jgi:ATP-dependent helicase Lhr and Lhr-like helicase
MSALEAFLPPVRAWFEQTLGKPTPPQTQAWPVIQHGDNTVILAPTGSGKTLAAFLCGIDALFREPARIKTRRKKAADTKAADAPPAGVRLLYISPLKALNNDVERNLQAPLTGIRAEAERMGTPLPELSVAVRTGDTSTADRQRMISTPPHILITTPESLYLMLTSPRAREIFRSVHTVIVDEIHTLVGDKRGAHLQLSLERLVELCESPPQRIGLSATVRPLEEVARFLGGQDHTGAPRPVAQIDARYKKAIDLQVVTAVDDLTDLGANSIWPAVVPRVLQEIQAHRTTLIFANNRRLAERTADRLNAQLDAEQNEEVAPGSSEALAPGGITHDGGMFAIGAQGPFRAHHGSMSKDARREMETQLKAGALPALVGTSSLELGIDIGSIDLVVQLQSPKSVAQGLQRVGRAGHLVGQTSSGRIYATHREDLMEAAAVARGMLDGDVEPTRAPENPLDVLSQQLVAMIAGDDFSSDQLFAIVQRAYSFRALPRSVFNLVLDALAGKYEGALAVLRPVIGWDKINDRLTALPRTRMAAISVAGVITDRGAFGVYLSDGKTKLGELDEEFVFETTVGNVFLLGSQTWRVTDIQQDRLIVADAGGETPRMPFWRGDQPWRAAELGERIGRFRRAVVDRIDEPGARDWLMQDYCCDAPSADNILNYVRGQLDSTGAIATDDTLLVERFVDETGARYWAIHSPYGGRVNGAWALALSSALRAHFGAPVETHVDDDGILLRLPANDDTLPVTLLRMPATEARERIVRELPDSALFGAHFRMNAQRALLLPAAAGRKRTPFWLQRLKAKDLLAIARQFDDFPIVLETYRDCLIDALDMPHLEGLLDKLQSGEIRLIQVNSKAPSPLAAGLLYRFSLSYLYEWDQPKAERQLRALTLRRDVLEDLLAERAGDLSALLSPAAVEAAPALQTASRIRDPESLANALFELGDLTFDEIAPLCDGEGWDWLRMLDRQGRAVELEIGPRMNGRPAQRRWVHAELVAAYGDGLTLRDPDRILRRYTARAGVFTRDGLLVRYALDPAWLDTWLADREALRELARGRFSPQASGDEYCEWRVLERMHSGSVRELRQAVQPVGLDALNAFELRWQFAHAETRLTGETGLIRVLGLLRGWLAPADVLRREILAQRVTGFGERALEAFFRSGDFVWVCAGRRVRILGRGEGAFFLDPAAMTEQVAALDAPAKRIHAFLRSEGASLIGDIARGCAMSPADVFDGLVALALSGLASADAYEALTAVQNHRRDETKPAAGSAPSSLESDLARRLGTEHGPAASAASLRRPSASSMRAARQRVTQRLLRDVPRQPWQDGWRWLPTEKAAVFGDATSEDARASATAALLLQRYGVVSYALFRQEALPVAWSVVSHALQRMELRGSLRRGLFVSGLGGLQFALPEAVEQLRAVAAELAHDDALTVLNATDPALAGIGLSEADRDGVKSEDAASEFSRVPSTHLVLWRGSVVLVSEDSARRLSAAPDAPADVLTRAVAQLVQSGALPRRIDTDSWNGAEVLGGPGEAILQHVGFGRTPRGMTLWR